MPRGGPHASGDLYQRQSASSASRGRFPFWSAAEPGRRHPRLPLGQYRYYVRVTEILEQFTFTDGFRLGLELYRFNPRGGSWTSEGGFTAQMKWISAPSGFPAATIISKATCAT